VRGAVNMLTLSGTGAAVNMLTLGGVRDGASQQLIEPASEEVGERGGRPGGRGTSPTNVHREQVANQRPWLRNNLCLHNTTSEKQLQVIKLPLKIG
jgi:hypothetical protein